MQNILYFLKTIKTFVDSFFRKITIGARVLLIQDGKILLIKHTYMPKWYSVGGGVEKGESPLQAIYREAQEEVGVRFLEPPSLLGVYINKVRKKEDYVVLYVAHSFKREPQSSFEIKDSQWFDLNALPQDISPATKRRIEEYQGLRTISDIW